MRTSNFSMTPRKIVTGLYALVLAAAITQAASGKNLDRIDLGNSQSETAHNLEAKGAEVLDYNALPKPEVRITEVTASVDEGGAVKTIDGDVASRWGAPRQPEIWIQYELSKATALDEVRIKIRDAGHLIPVTVQVSTDGEEWQRVYKGKTTVEKGGPG